MRSQAATCWSCSSCARWSRRPAPSAPATTGSPSASPRATTDIWSSRQCRGRSRSDVTVRRAVTTNLGVTWKARRSDDTCSRLTAWAMPGWYHDGVLGRGEPSDVQFELTTPRPRPSPDGEAMTQSPRDPERTSRQPVESRTSVGRAETSVGRVGRVVVPSAAKTPDSVVRTPDSTVRRSARGWSTRPGGTGPRGRCGAQLADPLDRLEVVDAGRQQLLQGAEVVDRTVDHRARQPRAREQAVAGGDRTVEVLAVAQAQGAPAARVDELGRRQRLETVEQRLGALGPAALSAGSRGSPARARCRHR